MTDPFGTAALRERVLAAWSASPARFREDANAEEELVLDGYRDRVLVELAQNAADAATRAGAAGRLRLTLAGDILRVANTGAPLDAAGVESASTLRASAKRDGAPEIGATNVGRFGVGFAAVLGVSDEPLIASRDGAVRWSRAAALDLIDAVPALRAERERRGDAVPVLRLPFPAEARPPEDFDTEVVLPLRDSDAVEQVRALLQGIDAALLLALPALREVDIDIDGDRRVIDARREGADVVIAGVRWRLSAASGTLPAELLADRPVEERARTTWSVCWAVPTSAAGEPSPLPATVPAVVHAPTPTDEPLGLPALLIGSFPLDSARRHVPTGALRDHLLRAAAGAYAALLAELTPSVSVLSLLPSGLGTGGLDVALRGYLAELLPGAPFLPAADPDLGGTRLRPRDAVAVEPYLVGALAPVLPGLLPAGFDSGALVGLGVRRLAVADVVDLLHGLRRDPAWWRSLYEALASGGVDRDALAALPVPLADGSMAASARGLLLAAPDADGADLFDLTPLGVRTVHADAAHPLLARLGALEGSPRSLLADARVRAAVAASFDDDDPAPVAAATLALVAAAGLRPAEMPWLADLALEGDDGDVYPAGELLMPGSELARVVAADTPFGTVAPALVERWGRDVLAAVGVLETFAIVTDTDVTAPDHDLDLEGQYLDFVASAFEGEAAEPAVVLEFVAVRDLELVADEMWHTALGMLSWPPLRDAVTAPAIAVCGGLRRRLPSYTAWWLRRRRVVEGLLPDADPLLDGLYETIDGEPDAEFLRAAGAIGEVADADPADILARLADPVRTVSRAQVRRLYSTVQAAEPPERLRAVRGDDLVVVEPSSAVVVNAPDLLPLVGRLAVVPVGLEDASRVARALGVRLASDLAPFPVLSDGSAREGYVVHGPLVVADVDGEPVRVPWRVVGGRLHVDSGDVPFGLGRGRAWIEGRWELRHRYTEELRQGVEGARLRAESDLDPA